MPEAATPVRWRRAVAQAARQVLSARWRSTLRLLAAARTEYGRVYAAPVIDVRAARKAAQRLHELEMLRRVLARELRRPA